MMCKFTHSRTLNPSPQEFPMWGHQLPTGQKRPRQSKVHFTDDAAIEYHDSHSPLSPDDARNMWYQRVELAFFKLAARSYLFGVNRMEEEARGFERLLNLDRNRSKAMAIKCVVLAHRKGMKADDVAVIAQRCSENAVEDAFLMGCQDFFVAYYPQLTSTVPRTIMSCNTQTARIEHGDEISRPIKKLRLF